LSQTKKSMGSGSTSSKT